MRRGCGIFLFLCFAVLRAELPEYAPPFAAENQKRQKPVLEVRSLPAGKRTVEQVALTAGNRQIGLRLRDSFSRISPDWKIVVAADGEEVCRIYFSGSFPGNSGTDRSFPPISEKFPGSCSMQTIRQNVWRLRCRSAGDR